MRELWDGRETPRSGVWRPLAFILESLSAMMLTDLDVRHYAGCKDLEDIENA